MVLLKGVWFGTLYKLQEITISDGCSSSIVPNIGVEEERTPTLLAQGQTQGSMLKSAPTKP
jgi:hypothetical protein